MMKIFQFVFLVFALRVSTIVGQSPCSSPSQWEASISGHDYVTRASVNATVSYDAVNKRQRVVETVWLAGKNYTFDVLYLDNLKVVYRFDFQLKKCFRVEVNESWSDLGVPSTAVFMNKQTIGSEFVKDAFVRTNLWRYEFSDRKGNRIMSFETWTDVGCLPVDFVHFSKAANVNMVKRFYDITPGIRDESVWAVRNECANL